MPTKIGVGVFNTKRSEVVHFPKLQLELPLEEIYEELEMIEDWVETQMARADEE